MALQWNSQGSPNGCPVRFDDISEDGNFKQSATAEDASEAA